VDNGIAVHEFDATTDKWHDESVMHGKLVVPHTRNELKVTLLPSCMSSIRRNRMLIESLRSIVRWDLVQFSADPNSTKSCTSASHSPLRPRA
jgi:hypothetical protein